MKQLSVKQLISKVGTIGGFMVTNGKILVIPMPVSFVMVCGYIFDGKLASLAYYKMTLKSRKCSRVV